MSLRHYYSIAAVWLVGACACLVMSQFASSQRQVTVAIQPTVMAQQVDEAGSAQPGQQRGGRSGFGDGGFGGGRGGGGFGGSRGFGGGGEQAGASRRSDYPMWELPAGFKRDAFTFVRIVYDSAGGRGGSFGGWANDYPDCDWNFSFRLSQLTSMAVDPNGKTLRLSDPELFDHPFIFMTNMGGISLDEGEREALRRYLMRGGFLMADDFWAAAEWQHIRSVMKEVLPDREPRELTLEHEIFHQVYDLKELPQVPSIRAWQRGMTYEDWHGPFERDDTSPHFWGYFDNDGRLAALFCHNNDVADGWEREGENIEYFARYSQRVSYPLGINIISYAMSH